MTWAVGAPGAPEVDADTLAELPGGAPADFDAAAPDDGGAPEVSEPMVRAALAAAGQLVAMGMAHPDIPRHWQPTADELDRMTPPATRLVNRSPAMRRVAAMGDPMLLGIEVVRFVTRNIDAQRRHDAAQDGSGPAGTPGPGAVRPDGRAGGDAADDGAGVGGRP